MSTLPNSSLQTKRFCFYSFKPTEIPTRRADFVNSAIYTLRACTRFFSIAVYASLPPLPTSLLLYGCSFTGFSLRFAVVFVNSPKCTVVALFVVRRLVSALIYCERGRALQWWTSKLVGTTCSNKFRLRSICKFTKCGGEFVQNS